MKNVWINEDLNMQVMKQQHRQNSKHDHGVHGHLAPLSHMYPAETTIDGLAHPTAEHAYQYAKATFAGDHAQAQKISDTTNPYTAKQLGKSVYMFLSGMHVKKRF